jgi:hypothetical protein
VESAANQVVRKAMIKQQQMRWTREAPASCRGPGVRAPPKVAPAAASPARDLFRSPSTSVMRRPASLMVSGRMGGPEGGNRDGPVDSGVTSPASPASASPSTVRFPRRRSLRFPPRCSRLRGSRGSALVRGGLPTGARRHLRGHRRLGRGQPTGLGRGPLRNFGSGPSRDAYMRSIPRKSRET